MLLGYWVSLVTEAVLSHITAAEHQDFGHIWCGDGPSEKLMNYGITYSGSIATLSPDGVFPNAGIMQIQPIYCIFCPNVRKKGLAQPLAYRVHAKRCHPSFLSWWAIFLLACRGENRAVIDQFTRTVHLSPFRPRVKEVLFDQVIPGREAHLSAIWVGLPFLCGPSPVSVCIYSGHLPQLTDKQAGDG